MTHHFPNRKYNFFKISASLVDLPNLIPLVLNNESNREELPQYIFVNVQVEGDDGQFFTIGERYPVDIKNKDSIDKYVNFLLFKYDSLDELYHTPESWIYYYVNYISMTEIEYMNKKDRINNASVKVEIPLAKEIPLNLPLNIHYNTWGRTAVTDSDGNLVISNLYLTSVSNVGSIRIKYNSAISRTIELISDDTVIKSISDKIVSDNEFIRTFDSKEYYIRNNVPYFFFERKFPHKNITSLPKNKNYIFNIMTLDIETYKDSNKIMHVYCISFFDGENSKSFYITDYENLDSMLTALFKALFTRTNTGKLLYIHNASMFDLNFLLKPLLSYDNITLNPTIKDGKFINLSIKYGKDGIYQLNLRDSMLLLPNSLAKLCKSFHVDNPKDIFPHEFVSPNNLNYVGSVPSYEYFDNKKVSLNEYNEYVARFNNQPWSLKAEAIKYCGLDCTSLYSVISNFSIHIFEIFQINIIKCPTLPSLAFRIYRTHYMGKDLKLPILVNGVFEDISKSYFGGHVDMYIPENKESEKLYWYDVNSLYPNEMKANKYPVSLLGHFKGNITTKSEYVSLYQNTDNVGFYKVNLVAPSIIHPILPTKSATGRTIFPEGSITGWYYSEELKNAEKLGYKYTILEGYIFSSKNIFDEFVIKLSEMKESANKNSAEYLIAKLLMNSLYGKFGMRPINTEHSYIKKNKVDEFIDRIGIDNILGNIVPIGDKVLISYQVPFENRYIKINVAIASAVTANARIHMSQFKNNPDITLYYSDTDSIVINKPLLPNLVHDKKIGYMKLEKILSKFIGLGPKVYGGETLEGEQFVKVKGLKNPPTLNELSTKLDINSPDLEIKQEKWKRVPTQGFIQVKDSPYNLQITSNKRLPIFNEKGRLIGTKNIIMTNDTPNN